MILPDTGGTGKTLRTSVSAEHPAVSWKVKCLNCGAALAGPFCAECGQRALPTHPTVKQLAGDAFSEFSGWDGKLAATLRLLLRRPGELTRQWLDGHRVSFISPVRLYLTTSLLYFLITAGAPTVLPSAAPGNRMDLGGLQVGASGSKAADRISAAASNALTTKKGLTGPARDSALADIASAPALFRPMLRRAIDEPAAFKNAINEAMPRAFFTLVPIFALILGIFYRHRNYPEHLYFAIHLHAFFFIARGTGNLALYSRSVPLTAVVQVVMVIWILAYSYLSLRKVYGGSVISNVAKGIAIGAIYIVVAGAVTLGTALIVAS